MATIGSDALKKAFAIQTGFQALHALANELPVKVLDRLLAKSMKPYSFLVELLCAAAPAAAAEATALERATARGLGVRQELLNQEGGLASAAQIAKCFHPPISRQAVDQRRKKGQLFALEDGSGHFNYPVWQVNGGAALPGLPQILAVLGGTDAMAAVLFYLQPDPRLSGQRPLDRAREGDVDGTLELARTFGEHGAL